MPKPFRHATVADHSQDRPDLVEADGSPTWITRGTNFVIAITRVESGTRLIARDVPDEHMILLPDVGATVTMGTGESRTMPGNHLVIVPPGDAEVVAAGSGLVVRCFSSRHAELLSLARNAAAFAERDAQLAPIEDWPAPPDGFQLRVYDLEAGIVENDKTRVYRSSNLMINILCERQVPRDTRGLSPHSHVDFEQGSITLKGVHIHYLRTPWVPDMSVWRPDEAVEVGSPSVTVIPPPIIHTTRNIGEGPALLVDLFCPPRADFAKRPGMIRNVADYPLPPNLVEN
ncbi:hypothetical protein [Caballeronia sp. DA-9]|uniref:hypothetical protein n=1 Tax=Caballeronia sp. DA-9 TaxID=3436237 RepID=UPI003F66BAB7